MAGLTPFQFSSSKIQYETNQSLFGATGFVNSLTGGLVDNALSWYEMWINPDKVTISSRYLQKQQQTVASIVTFHYRQENPVLKASGMCGWVRIQSDKEIMQNNIVNDLMSSKLPGSKNSATRQSAKNLYKDLTANPLTRLSGSGNSLDNSPRVFLKRLKDLADDPPYFIDKDGIEHINVKMLKIFTKQFPTGALCEGFFTNFEIPESVDDGETIPYSFEFIIQNLKSITLLQRLTGMFASQGQAVGGLMRAF